jgi:hypothetical protein
MLDDNVGHWQVEPHPFRAGWTRLLYSCKVKLQPWIPEFVVNSLTSSALSEVTYNPLYPHSVATHSNQNVVFCRPRRG